MNQIKLRPNQEEVLAEIKSRNYPKRLMFNLYCRFGKTYLISYLLAYVKEYQIPDDKKILIIDAEKRWKMNWKKVLPEFILKKVIFATYQTCDKWIDMIDEIEFVIVDEAHRMQNYKSKQTKNILKFAANPNIPFCFLLSGTPFSGKSVTFSFNHVIDYTREWAYFKSMLNPPLRWKSGMPWIHKVIASCWHFCHYFFNACEKTFGSSNRKIIYYTTFQNEEVRNQFNAFKEQFSLTRLVPAELSQHLEYLTPLDNMEEMRESIWIKYYDKAPKARLTNMGYLQAIRAFFANHNAIIDPMISNDPKEQFVMSHLDKPTLIFSSSRRALNYYAELFKDKQIKYGYLHGVESGYSIADQSKSIQNFQTGEYDILLITYGSGSEGIDLSRAEQIIMLDLDWSYTTNEQAINRAWTETKTDKDLKIWILCYNNYIERKQNELILSKRRNIEKELIQLFSPNN